MHKTIDDRQLEAYLRDTLSDSLKQRIEKALKASAELRIRLETITDELRIEDAARDSRAIRLSDQDERRVVASVMDTLRTSLEEVNEARPDRSD